MNMNHVSESRSMDIKYQCKKIPDWVEFSVPVGCLSRIAFLSRLPEIAVSFLNPRFKKEKKKATQISETNVVESNCVFDSLTI